MYDITYNIDEYDILRNIEHLEYIYILAKKHDSEFFSISRYLRNHNPQPRPYSIQRISQKNAQHLKKLVDMEFINEIAKLHINPLNHKRR